MAQKLGNKFFELFKHVFLQLFKRYVLEWMILFKLSMELGYNKSGVYVPKLKQKQN